MGISPAAGYFGPVTRSSIKCSTTTTTTTGSTTSNSGLGNDAGSIKSVSGVSSEDNDVREGESAEIIAADVEVEGDIESNRVDFYLESDSAASENSDDYFQSASLIVAGKTVATLDESDWDEDDYDVVTNDSTDGNRLRLAGRRRAIEHSKTPVNYNSLAHRTTWLRSDL